MPTNQELLTQTIALLNSIIESSKTTAELDAMSTIDQAALLRVYVGGVSKKLALGQILESALLQQQTNKFIAVTGYELDENELTVNAGWQWNISGQNFMNEDDTVITIPYASAGYTRIDIIAASAVGTFYRIAGTEGISEYAPPAIPTNALVATFITVTEDTVGEPTDPPTGYYLGLYPSVENFETFFGIGTREFTTHGAFALISDGSSLTVAVYVTDEWEYFAVGGGGGSLATQTFTGAAGSSQIVAITGGKTPVMAHVDGYKINNTNLSFSTPNLTITFPFEGSESIEILVQ